MKNRCFFCSRSLLQFYITLLPSRGVYECRVLFNIMFCKHCLTIFSMTTIQHFYKSAKMLKWFLWFTTNVDKKQNNVIRLQCLFEIMLSFIISIFVHVNVLSNIFAVLHFHIFFIIVYLLKHVTWKPSSSQYWHKYAVVLHWEKGTIFS